MSSKAPPIPKEQRSFANVKASTQGRRDEIADVQSDERGGGHVNVKQQGRQGNIWQNTHHQGHQQDR